jgi:hypothetical protein
VVARTSAWNPSSIDVPPRWPCLDCARADEVIEYLSLDVAYWPKCEVQTGSGNVCFLGWAGHTADIRIREVLDTLAIKHDIAVKDITYAMACADDMLADTIYNVERELEREIEDEDPV